MYLWAASTRVNQMLALWNIWGAVSPSSSNRKQDERPQSMSWWLRRERINIQKIICYIKKFCISSSKIISRKNCEETQMSSPSPNPQQKVPKKRKEILIWTNTKIKCVTHPLPTQGYREHYSIIQQKPRHRYRDVFFSC